MGKSAHPRLPDVRAAYRLVGECRELGDDPVAWRRRLVEGMMQLVGARIGLCGEVVLADGDYTKPHVALGWEGNQADVWGDYLREHVGKDDLFWERVSRNAALSQTVRRCDYVADDEWYRQAYVDESWRAADVDHIILSGRICRRNEPTLDGVILLRAWGEKPFTRRLQWLVALLHDEIAPLVGRQLAAVHEPGPSALSPRKRQVLECVLDGDTDRQIALRLGICDATVSEHLTAVFRHFGVGSRAQLLAYFLKRYRKSSRCAASEP